MHILNKKELNKQKNLLTNDIKNDKIPNANTSNLIRINLPRGIGVHLEVLSRRSLPSVRRFFIRIQKKRAKAKPCGSCFFSRRQKEGKMDFKKIDKKESIYVVAEKMWGDWYIRNIFSTYTKAVNFIYKAREWEKRWKEQGFTHAPRPAIYKIIRFTEAETFTIED